MRGYLPVAPMLCVPSTASGRPITPGRLQGTHLFDLELHGLRAVIYENGTVLLLRGAERSPPDDGGLPPSARFSVCVPASQCSLVLRKVVENFLDGGTPEGCSKPLRLVSGRSMSVLEAQ